MAELLAPETWIEQALDVVPFRFLATADRRWVAERLKVLALGAGDTLFEQGEAEDDTAYLLLQGEVETFDRGRPAGVFTAGHLVGERSALLCQPRALTVLTRAPAVVAALGGADLRALLRRSRVFADQLAWRLREKQGLFEGFQRFRTEVELSASRGHLVLARLLPLYRAIRPALHPLADDPTRLDLDALAYALPRLPTNLTRTFAWYLTDELPHLYSRPVEVFARVDTPARRRAIWEMMPGKNLVLLRDGLSDLLDLVSCLCLYAVEARKLRQRLQDPALLLDLAQGREPRLPFAPTELSRLRQFWPDLPRALFSLASHHEDFTITIQRSQSSHHAAHAERWIAQLADAVQRLLGVPPHALPEDFPVHLVSSNTHSVGNCLSGWLATHQAEILAWGAVAQPALYAAPFPDPRDRVVALARSFLAAHPEAEAERRRVDDDAAVVHLDESAFTGIDVQLFDLARLADRAPAVSGWLETPLSKRPGLLVNVDYAFGQQAEAILGNLLALFGRRVRSVDILGKAGGLAGQRGDLLIATSFVEQPDDLVHVPRLALNRDRLAARVPGRQVFAGPVLTVLGTVLQNPTLLHYYRQVFGCVGLEMEGSYQARQVLSAVSRGLLDPEVSLRFLYYVSDLPLSHQDTLAGSLTPLEGIPPLYAITREVLASVLGEPPGP